MFSRKLFPLLALLSISFLNVTYCASQETGNTEAIPWPFWVVERSSTWVRPSLEEQKETWLDNRFSPGDMKQFKAFFFDAPDGTNVPGYLKINAGILDKFYAPRAPMDTLPVLEAWHIEALDSLRGEGELSAFFGFFSLFHRIVEMRWEGNSITALAEPVQRGFEQIAVAWPPVSEPVQMKIVDSNGKKLWEKEYQTSCGMLPPPSGVFTGFNAIYPYFICIDRPSQNDSKEPFRNITGTNALREYDLPTSEAFPPGVVEAVENGALKAYVFQNYALKDSRFGPQTQRLEVGHDGSPVKPNEIATRIEIGPKSHWEQVVIFFYPHCYPNLPIAVDGIVYRY